ncbi:MAG: FecR domain-containing protein [Gammaproteobacteria bacterium]|nr:FecR domain-containing protein [Gammaproteobacteria bacterium]
MSNQDSGSRDDPIEQLIKSAGRGPSASPEARARVYAAVRDAWRREAGGREQANAQANAQAATEANPRANAQTATQADSRAVGDARAADIRAVGSARAARAAARPRRRPMRWLAAAAALGAVALLVRLEQATDSPGEPVATLAVASGPVYVDGQTAGADVVVTEGGTLRTGAGGRAAVGLAAGAVMRVDEETEVLFASPARVDLRRGTLYVDSGVRPSATTVGAVVLDVQTPLGTVRHVGTQYEVRFADARVRVRVREGQVLFEDEAREIAAMAGDQVTIAPQGAPMRSAIAAHDPAWDWVEGLATVRGGDSQTLDALLRWLSRETGRELRFADAAAEREAGMLVLHGVEGLTPDELLDVIASTTSFSYSEAEAGTLLVSHAP